jgi:hypothetical protein
MTGEMGTEKPVGTIGVRLDWYCFLNDLDLAFYRFTASYSMSPTLRSSWLSTTAVINRV